MANQSIIKIDKALRTACVLSAVTKKPCWVFNIPNLSAQELLEIQSLSQLCLGRLEGDKLGSKEIKFFPGEFQEKPDSLRIKIETAGSITLILQTLILPALFASSPTKIIFDSGATDTFFSPTFDYFNYVFLKILGKIGIKAETNLIKRGYYPEGGAKVEVTVFPSTLKKLNLTERGELKKILVISGASEFLKTKKIAERQIAGVREVLGKLNLPIEEKCDYYPTQCLGSQICLIAEFENTIIGTDNLGKLGKRAEDIGKEAALELLKEEKTGACLDKHLSDQILPYMALAEDKSSVTVSEITEHCKTNIWVIEKFINGRFKIKDNLISWLPR
ncbi:RNA 3'-phosphate cyclase [Candidatus Parcubacteria bacterium]|nr:RNA 3'-phosphate cyclase [Candidatus Parcubacteria bacterium]